MVALLAKDISLLVDADKGYMLNYKLICHHHQSVREEERYDGGRDQMRSRKLSTGLAAASCKQAGDTITTLWWPAIENHF